MNIALFGGSFNPIHQGHVDIINDLSKNYDQVWIIPSYITPGKTETFNEKARIDMIKIAVKQFSNVIINEFEINNKCVSYTAHTIKHIISNEPNNAYTFVFGFDNIKTFDTWREAEYIAQNVKLKGYYRDEYQDHQNIKKFNIEMAKIIPSPISSTKIRVGEGLKYCHPEVLNHMLINNMYIDDILLNFMNEDRKDHVLDVADYSKQLAKHYGIDENKAYIAGLLHDITKQLDDEKQLKIAQILDVDTNIVPKPVLHQYTAKYVINNDFNILDDEITDAISKHTSADVEMSELAMVLYIADYACPTRDVENPLSKDIRAMVNDSSLIDVFKAVLINSYNYETSKRDNVYHKTLNAYNKYIVNK